MSSESDDMDTESFEKTTMQQTYIQIQRKGAKAQVTFLAIIWWSFFSIENGDR